MRPTANGPVGVGNSSGWLRSHHNSATKTTTTARPTKAALATQIPIRLRRKLGVRSIVIPSLADSPTAYIAFQSAGHHKQLYETKSIDKPCFKVKIGS